MFVNHGLGKHSKGDCRPKTPALWGFPPPDGGRRDASSGRAWARRFMGDNEVPQLTLDSSPLRMIFPARFCAILYIWLKILNWEKSRNYKRGWKISLSPRARYRVYTPIVSTRLMGEINREKSQKNGSDSYLPTSHKIPPSPMLGDGS